MHKYLNWTTDRQTCSKAIQPFSIKMLVILVGIFWASKVEESLLNKKYSQKLGKQLTHTWKKNPTVIATTIESQQYS